MEKPIMHDPLFLSRRSADADVHAEEDRQTARDLSDTLKAHKEECVGMAANMIGVLKRIIIADDNGTYLLLWNPEYVSQSAPYQTEEGCLSLDGVRTVRRYGKIKVRFQDESGKTRIRTFSGRTAQIIQHEMDHCMGILI